VKEEVKKKKKVKKEEEVVVTETKVKKVKKVYDLPGQKRDPPEEVCITMYFLLFIFTFMFTSNLFHVFSERSF